MRRECCAKARKPRSEKKDNYDRRNSDVAKKQRTLPQIHSLQHCQSSSMPVTSCCSRSPS
ncbi:hypothetical protein EMPG_17373 [Blastomyces silverae]|uniref:Uncharacterized protein n=1 Tax=Blastomyces silverae TaxID=2060906 RepID=A0A0H1BCZ6_9EURO|nr:hypothetical protein EMPG_17373 [Blastomyces silverae]